MGRWTTKVRAHARTALRKPRPWLAWIVISPLLILPTFPKTSAAVVQVDANVAGVYTDLTFLTPTTAVLSDGDSFGGLSIGDGVVIHIDVSNFSEHDVRAIFLSLHVDPNKLSYVGGSFEPNILIAPTPFGVTFLTAVDSSPEFQVGDSSFSTLTGPSYGEPLGTTGRGPDFATTKLEFQVLDDSTDIDVELQVGFGNGLLIDGTAIDGSNIGSHASLISLDSATLYLPEPSVTLLLILGVSGICLIEALRLRRRARAASSRLGRSSPAVPLVTVAILLAAGVSISQIIDTDTDGVPDVFDNCPFVPNGPLDPSNQVDSDLDFVGDVCDSCPSLPNENQQTDSDVDGLGDVCDNCTLVPNGPSDLRNQNDTDQDGFGDVCDPDYDQNGYILGLDIVYWIQHCSSMPGIPECDLRGNGTGGDILTYLHLTNDFNHPVGPSGLACATIPPVNVGNGDPPCVP
ncbi:MAG: thrombospondin type 3 repeat-containing protein [Deltaproteobacteria bacterium]|nr:thrombospondin type 3 repeat-containing protein [Deltaproteobacteria bacterium]